jgi:hypothetical protein
MKKIIIVLILAGLTILFSTEVKAEDYQTFQEVVFNNDDALLLKDFSKSDYDDYYDEIKRKKFIGWKLFVANENEEVEFVSETKLKIYNNGYSTIKHDIKLESKEETKYQISATGGIKVNVKGNVKKFKGSVDADIKASISYTKTTTNKETYDFQIIVDPKTYVKIVTRGTGEVNNGVGNYYFLWIRTKKGGWETFNVTTEYYEIIKERLR